MLQMVKETLLKEQEALLKDNERWTTLASCVLRNKALNLASAAEAATSLRMAHVIAILPLSLMGSLLLGRLPRKK